MRTLWGAATVKLLGAGLDEAAFVEDVSRLVGEHDVPADSWSHGDGHHPDQLDPASPDQGRVGGDYVARAGRRSCQAGLRKRHTEHDNRRAHQAL